MPGSLISAPNGSSRMRHPQPPVVRLVEVLVEEEHVRRQLPGAVESGDRLRERREVHVGGLREPDGIHGARGTRAGIVVDPQHVVVARGEDRAGDLELDAVLVQVGDLVPARERPSDDASDQRVDLDLVVVLLRRERELHRQPDAARVVPLLDECARAPP